MNYRLYREVTAAHRAAGSPRSPMGDVMDAASREMARRMAEQYAAEITGWSDAELAAELREMRILLHQLPVCEDAPPTSLVARTAAKLDAIRREMARRAQPEAV